MIYIIPSFYNEHQSIINYTISNYFFFLYTNLNNNNKLIKTQEELEKKKKKLGMTPEQLHELVNKEMEVS